MWEEIETQRPEGYKIEEKNEEGLSESMEVCGWKKSVGGRGSR